MSRTSSTSAASAPCMDCLKFAWSLCLLCLVLWIGEYKVSAKCAGKWAIHACGGGNAGKRSGGSSAPLVDEGMDGMDRGALNGLQRLFLQRARTQDATLRDLEQAQRLQAFQNEYTPESEYSPREGGAPLPRAGEEEYYGNARLDSGEDVEDLEYLYPRNRRYPSHNMLVQKLIKLAQMKNSGQI